MITQEINDILGLEISKDRKITMLRHIFEKYAVDCFVDLDGTLTSHRDIFYVKVRFLKTIGATPSQIRALLHDYTIKKNFLTIAQTNKIQRFFILTRNYQDFLELFIEETQGLFAAAGLEIVGGLGRSDALFMLTEDKMSLLPADARLVSDIFEYPAFHHMPRFISVDRFSNRRYLRIVGIKIRCFFLFLLTKSRR